MPERDSVAYVVQRPRHRDNKSRYVDERGQVKYRYKEINMLPLLEWGSPVLLLEDDEASMLNTAAMERKLKRKLAGFREQDYIVASGAPAAIGIACAIVALRNRGRFKVLVWDRQEEQYYPVQANILEET